MLFSNDRPYDILINLRYVKDLQQGLPLYAWSANASSPPLFFTFISSPVVAPMLLPLANLDPWQAVVIFRGISLILYLLAILVILKANNIGVHSGGVAFGVFCLIALSWEPTFDSVGLGQLDEIIVFFLALAYWGWTRRDSWLAGLGVGVAAAIKISPILIVIYWIFKRKWRPALIALGVMAVLSIVASHIVSWQQATTFVFSIFPAISRGSPYYYNQTIAGFWSRIYLPPETFDWLGLEVMPEVAAARLLALSLGLLLIVATVAFTYKFAGHYAEHRVGAALEFNICLVLILVISPISWWHYFVWLTIPIGALFCQDVFTRLKPLRRQYTRILIPTAVLLINIPPNALIARSLLFAKSSLFLADLWMSIGLMGALTLLVTLVFIYRAYPARSN